MGLMSRRKGQHGEREVAALISDLTGWTVTRRCRQHGGDDDLLGLPGWAPEVKRHKSASRAEVAGWWRQCVLQAGDLRPLLLFRRDRDEWRAVWQLSVLLAPAAKWHDYSLTIEGSVTAWAACAREIAPIGASPAAGQEKRTES